MLKTKSKILLALFIILTLACSYCFATVEPRTAEPVTTSEEGVSAISETEGDAITTSEENTDSLWTNSDLYVCDEKVEISNVVDGNAFVVGNEVTISGEIGGDLFVVANKLNIDGGYIYSNVFAFANEITINGVVYDIYAVCDTFNLENNGFIYRDMRVTASNLNINGKVRRNAFVSAENINLNADAGTVIYGDLNYSSKNEIEIPEGTVTGETNYKAINFESNTNTVADTILFYVLDLLQTLFFTLIITIILLWLTPKFVERVGNMKVGKSFACLGIGFATPIALIFASILLIISSIGVSIFAVSIFTFIILAFIGNTVTSIFFGKLLAKAFKMESNIKLVLLTLASSLILWAISIIPFVGILSSVASIFGIGTTLVNMIVRKEKVEEKTEIKE